MPCLDTPAIQLMRRAAVFFYCLGIIQRRLYRFHDNNGNDSIVGDSDNDWLCDKGAKYRYSPLMRIAKFIAHSGFCSRREAERLIAEGKVTLDGVTLTTPATLVAEGQEVRVGGKLLQMQITTKLWKFHKPRGVITSKRDEKGRQTIYDLLPPELQNVLYIGRLDYNSEGLLLLTNDGTLKREWELPSTGLERSYRVRILGIPSDETLRQIRAGVTIEGVRYQGMKVQTETDKLSRNLWLRVTLTEGKNREIRTVFEHFGHQVSRLIRTHYGKYALGTLAPGKVEEVRMTQRNALAN